MRRQQSNTSVGREKRGSHKRQKSLVDFGHTPKTQEEEDAEVITDLMEAVTSEVWRAGETIITAGDVGSCMYFVISGEVEIELYGVNSPDNPRLGPGSFFGEIALFLEEKRVANVIAMTQTELGVLTRTECDEVIGRYPHMDAAWRDLAKERMSAIKNKRQSTKGSPSWMSRMAKALTRTSSAPGRNDASYTVIQRSEEVGVSTHYNQLISELRMLALQARQHYRAVLRRTRGMRRRGVLAEMSPEQLQDHSACVIQRLYRASRMRLKLKRVTQQLQDMRMVDSKRAATMNRFPSQKFRQGEGAGLMSSGADADERPPGKYDVNDSVSIANPEEAVDEEMYHINEAVNRNMTRRLDEALVLQNMKEEQTMSEEERRFRDEVMRDHTGRALKSHEREKIAAVYIKDSMKGRPHVRRSRFARRVHAFGHHVLWRFLIFTLILLHMGLAFFEPASWREYSEKERNLTVFLLVIELIFVVVYLFDIFVKMLAKGAIEFGINESAYVVCVALILTDAVVALVTGNTFRFSRPFRSLLLTTRSSKLRDVCTSVLRTLPQFINIAAIIGVLIVTYAIIMLQLFFGYYESGGEGSFNTFGESSLALFVLLTSENYPDIMLPAFRRSPWYSLLFISFVILGLFLLFNVLVGIILSSWGKLRRSKAVEQRMVERKNLMVAFRLLDMEGDGYLNYEKWQNLMKILHPDMRGSQVLALFSKMDVESDGRIDLMEFFSLIDVLHLKVKQTRKGNRTYFIPRKVVSCFERNAPQCTRFLVHNPAFSLISYLLVLANVVVLCLFGQVGEQHFKVLYILNFVFLCLFLLEFALKLAGHGLVRFFKDNKNRFDFAILVSQIAAQLLIFFVGGQTSFNAQTDSRSTEDTFLRLFHATSALRALRLLSGNPRFRIVGHTILQCVPLFSQMAYLAGVIFYFFAIVGMELFSRRLPFLNEATSFNNFHTALLTLFQMLTTSNWHEIMYPAMQATSPYSSWYFVLFNISICVVILNILIAFVIDTFVWQYDRNLQKWRDRHRHAADVAGFKFEENDQREVISAIANIDNALPAATDLPPLPMEEINLEDMASVVMASRRDSSAFGSINTDDLPSPDASKVRFVDGQNKRASNVPSGQGPAKPALKRESTLTGISEHHQQDGVDVDGKSGSPRSSGRAPSPSSPSGDTVPLVPPDSDASTAPPDGAPGPSPANPPPPLGGGGSAGNPAPSPPPPAPAPPPPAPPGPSAAAPASQPLEAVPASQPSAAVPASQPSAAVPASQPSDAVPASQFAAAAPPPDVPPPAAAPVPTPADPPQQPQPPTPAAAEEEGVVEAP